MSVPDGRSNPGAGTQQESAELYSALFKHNQLVMLLIEPADGRIVDANRAAIAFYGWSREELVGKAIDEIHTLPADQVAAELERVRVAEQNFFRFRHRLANGEERDVEVFSGPVRVKGRRLLYSIVHDVTVRPELAQRLLRAESLQRIAGGLARVGGWAVDVATQTVYLSDELCRMLAVAPGTSLTVAECIDYYAPQYRGQIRNAFDECVAHAVPYDSELEILRPDGVRLWVRTIGEAIQDSSGRVVGVHGVFQDITDQRRAQDRMRQLWLAVEQSPESIVVTDLAPSIIYVNDAACRISGYSRAELLGRNPRSLGSGKTPEATYATMWARLGSGRPWSGIFHNRRKDGREYTERASITPVRQSDGEITHYLAIKEDITAKRQTERELARYRDHLEELVEERTRQLADARQEAEAASRAKSTFLARMSHEIRTPMNGILGSIEILEQQQLSRDQAELLGTIRDSGQVLLHIIEDILDFSRIEAGRMQLDVAEFAPAELVESLCDQMVPLALEKEVDLYCYVAPELPCRVMGDDVRVRQILANLVGNAIKFSAGPPERRGRVNVRVTQAGAGELCIEVEDNGIGISPEAQARLFQPFSQLEESTTRRFGGSGLGLVICKRLTDLMRGDIGLESVPGKGSMFWVRLPVSAVPGGPAVPLPDLAGIRVALADSAALPAAYFRRYLAEAGATVSGADGDGAAADVVVAVADETVADETGAGTGAGTGAEAATAPAAGRVWLQRNARRAPQQRATGEVMLTLAATRRRSLLEAVAVAAGRRVAPRDEAESASGAVAAEVPDIDTAAARGELILVAEDDAINRMVIVRQLQLLGRAAEVAEDGAQALTIWRRGRTALLLTDLHMPEMDGYELTREIRHEEGDAGRPRAERTPVVALTANALHGEAERVAELGFDDYVTKPATLERLRAVLERWLPGEGTAGEEPVAANLAEEPVLDVSVLEKLIGARGEMVEEFLDAFLQSASGLASDIDRACVTRDMRQLAAVTHKLKSSARSVGALALGALCARFEQESRAGRVAFDAGPGQAIRAGLETVRSAVEQRRGGKARPRARR